jgi:hypothetical protein
MSAKWCAVLEETLTLILDTGGGFEHAEKGKGRTPKPRGTFHREYTLDSFISLPLRETCAGINFIHNVVIQSRVTTLGIYSEHTQNGMLGSMTINSPMCGVFYNG